MSKIKVNSIEAATGTTITIPSGQTLDISSTTLTLPSTVVTTTGTQTLTNKTIGVSQLTGTLPITNGGTGLTTLGSATQVLRVNSGATALEFASPSSGSYTFLGATGTQSNVSSVDVNGFFTSDYDVYKIFLSGIYGASNATIKMRVNTTGSYTTQTGSDYNSTVIYNTNTGTAYIAGDVYNSDTMFYLSHIGTSSSAAGSGEITIYNPMSTSLTKNFQSHVYGRNSGNRFNIVNSHDWNSTDAITGVRFLAGSGNIYFSNIRIYGIKNS